MFAQDIGIDLGSANTVIVTKRRGIVSREPSVVAVNRHTHTVVAVGTEARNMIGRTPDTIMSIRPVQGGVISDLSHSTALMKHMIRKIAGSRWLRPRVFLTIQTTASAVDKRALAEAAVQAGAGDVYLLEEPLAAALGAGLPVDRPVGSLVVDIGSGSVDVAVISLGGVVASASSDAAGDQMDEAIARYVKREYNLLIGTPTAERIKLQFGSAMPGTANSGTITGRLLTTGIPAVVRIQASEVYRALSDSLAQLDALILSVIERTPPELLSDISQTGMTLTGGVAMLPGLTTRLTTLTGLPVQLAEAPLDAVAMGTSRLMQRKQRDKLQRIKP